MHDPLTMAFQIKYPWRGAPSKMWPNGYRSAAITIWHKDPESDGSDDSCGWFMRSRHGDQETLKKIVNDFEFEWDRIYTSEDGKVYFCGLFDPSGNPNLSVHGIVLNLFWIAARIHFDGSWERARKFTQKHLVEILIFAENPTDSLFNGITRKFHDCNKAQTPRERQERVENLAACIYSWVLRAERPWWKHPRWHFWHWRFQVHSWQIFRRWAFDRCCKCGRGFKWGESPITDWNETKIWHESCDNAGCCAQKSATESISS